MRINQTDALFATLEVESRDFDVAVHGGGSEYVWKSGPSKATIADLHGRDAVFDRVIDPRQRLAIDAFVDGRWHAIQIDHKNGDAGFIECNAGATLAMSCVEASGPVFTKRGTQPDPARWFVFRDLFGEEDDRNQRNLPP